MLNPTHERNAPRAKKAFCCFFWLIHGDKGNWDNFHSSNISWGRVEIAGLWWHEAPQKGWGWAAVLPCGSGTPPASETLWQKEVFSGTVSCLGLRGGCCLLMPNTPGGRQGLVLQGSQQGLDEWHGWGGSCSHFLAWLPSWMCGWRGLRHRDADSLIGVSVSHGGDDVSHPLVVSPLLVSPRSHSAFRWGKSNKDDLMITL